VRTAIKINEAAEGDYAYYLKKNVTPLIRPCHKSKGSPCVGYVSNIKKSLPNRQYFIKIEVRDYHGLGNLICEYNQESHEQKGFYGKGSR